MQGPFPISVAAGLIQGDAPFAVYLAGETRGRRFTAHFVDRCRTEDLAAALERLSGAHREFMFDWFRREQDAFRSQCVAYHLHHLTLHTSLPHPPRVDGSDWICPGCRTFNL